MRYWWDLDGDGMYEGTTTTATYNYTYPGPGMFTAGVMVEDTHNATGTDTVSITVNAAGNNLPVADLYCSPQAIDPGDPVWLHAEGSSDSDGSIADYEWDMDGDGTYNEAGDEADNRGDSTIEISFSQSGAYSASVRVTDDDGSPDVAAIEMTVNGWYVTTVDSAGDVGSFYSLVVVDGRPAISYFKMSSSNLRYIRASNVTGSSWGTPVTADGNGIAGLDTYLRVVSGYPAITCFENTDIDLFAAWPVMPPEQRGILRWRFKPLAMSAATRTWLS